MKKYIKNLFVVVFFVGIFLVSSLGAKTIVPTLKKVNTPTKASTKSSFSMGSGGNYVPIEEPTSPLDKPFSVKHAYPGTNVATDLVALDIHSHIGNNVCTGTRFHKRWFITAAHCFSGLFDSNVNPRIVFSVKQLPNGVWQVGISEPKPGALTNGTLYFYRNGYFQSVPNGPQNPYSHAEDIAIIGLDEKDAVISSITDKMQKLNTVLSAQALPSIANLLVTTNGQEQMEQLIKDNKRFLQLSLNGYHFMTFSPESARLELAGRKANGYLFEPVIHETTKAVLNRKLPVKYPFTYIGIPTNDDHTVEWQGKEPDGMSGTPLIINGYIVTVGSGEGKNPLFTDDFTAFLKRYMGADYKQGLCVRSVANEEAITERTQP